MRVIVMGQQAFGRDVLERLAEGESDEVVAVYCEPDRDGKPLDPIKELALERGLPVHQPASFDETSALETLRALEADLMIMAFVNVFVPEAARDAPRLGSICFHPSLLPLHRGPSAVNWPIVMGSTRSGFTWFYPTDGLDEGDVLLRHEVAIEPDDTVIDLYFSKIYPAAIASVDEVLEHFRTGAPPRTAQDESAATYERRCTAKHARIDWRRPVGQVYDLIRGTNPAPGAWTTHDGTTLGVFDARRVPGDGVATRVMTIDENGVEVQSVGGRILVLRVRPDGGKKVAAGEWAASVGLAVGDELGS